MRAFVINVPATVDEQLSRIRREHIVHELTMAGLEYQFVAAIDGLRLTAEERATLVDPDALAVHSSWLKPGVIGASLSHLQAYREIRSSGDPLGLVLEDDVTLDPDLLALLDDIVPRMDPNEIVLLYWRTWPGCKLSSHASEGLVGGRRLLFPMNPHRLNCASAYIITREACETMLHELEPVWTGTDAWGEFHDKGAFERIRCVASRPVGMRTDFKSTVDYIDTSSIAGRLLTVVARRRVFPFHQLLSLRRARHERRMSAFEIVDEPSPMA